jgi:hypothetical protein
LQQAKNIETTYKKKKKNEPTTAYSQKSLLFVSSKSKGEGSNSRRISEIFVRLTFYN